MFSYLDGPNPYVSSCHAFRFCYLCCLIVITNIGISIVLLGMSSQPNKGKAVWEEDNDEGERSGVWEEALRRVREKDAAEAERKKKEAEEAKREDYWRLTREHLAWEAREKKRHEAIKAERQRKFEENTKRAWELASVKKERENMLQLERVAQEARLIKEERGMEQEGKKESHAFFDSVVQLARDLREKEEVAEEVRKRKAKGMGAFSTQG